MRTYTKDDVRTHYGSDRPAVNVKVYDSIQDGWRKFEESEEHDPDFTLEWVEARLAGDRNDSLFWIACEAQFEQAVTDAEEILGVRAEQVELDGRSGGWLVVTGLPDIEEWDAIQLAKWRKFERFARDLADYVMAEVVSLLYINDFEWQKAEDAERERAANQDIATV